MTNEQKKQIIENEFNSPAFPPQLVQDKFGQLVAPLPGMTKLEYFTIQIRIQHLKQKQAVTITESIQEAKLLIAAIIEERLNKQEPTISNLSLT